LHRENFAWHAHICAKKYHKESGGQKVLLVHKPDKRGLLEMGQIKCKPFFQCATYSRYCTLSRKQKALINDALFACGALASCYSNKAAAPFVFAHT